MRVFNYTDTAILTLIFIATSLPIASFSQNSGIIGMAALEGGLFVGLLQILSSVITLSLRQHFMNPRVIHLAGAELYLIAFAPAATSASKASFDGVIENIHKMVALTIPTFLASYFITMKTFNLNRAQSTIIPIIEQLFFWR